MARTITVNTQGELDGLPESFDEYTIIEARSDGLPALTIKRDRDNSRVVARGNSRVVASGNSRVEARDNSRVEAWGNSRVVASGNSRVVAWGNSRVEAWGNSRVEAWGNSVIDNYSKTSSLTCGDNASAYLSQEPAQFIISEPSSVNIIRKDDIIKPSFIEWLNRGYVVADGIYQRLVSKKSQGEVTIYKTEDALGEEFFVAQKGNKFAHAKTASEAVADLRYKISDRDNSKYKEWDIETSISADEAIEAYRVITGACAEGCKIFCESKSLKDKYTIAEVIEVTRGQFGSDQFSAFFNNEDCNHE